MRNGVRVRIGNRASSEEEEREQGWEWGVGWDVARAVEQEPEHRALPGFRTRRDEAAPVPVPPRPHCLGAGAEGREAQAERREAPAAPAPAASADGPAMAPAPRLALLAAALLCAPGKWEQHREWQREWQLAPGTGTDPDPSAPRPPSCRDPLPRGPAIRVDSSLSPRSGSLRSSGIPGAGETSPPPPPPSPRSPGSASPIPRDSCRLHHQGSRGGHPGNVGSAGISRGESPPSPQGNPPPEGLPLAPDPGICLASPHTPDCPGGISSRP